MQMLGNVDPGVSIPLNAPTSLSNTPTTTSVAIAFTPPTLDGGAPIINYEYSFNNSTWTALSPADAISPITVSGLSANTSYTVYLRAVNIVGSGPASVGTTFTTVANSYVVEYVVVAGGGGSGGSSNSYNSGGGGGAGGYRSSVAGESTGRGGTLESALTIAVGSSIAVAVGGAGASGYSGGGGTAGAGGVGGTSTFSSISSTGGGGGGAGANGGASASNGGAGGGASNSTLNTAGNGIAGQGFDGRYGPGSYSGGGGGAGAGGSPGNNTSQYGGTGIASSITGTSTYRAGGGGGAYNQPGGGVNTSSLGGGGRGGQGRDDIGVAGTTNTGGGGGGPNTYGAGHQGSAGGSGIVIIRYPNTQPDLTSIGAGLVKTGAGLTPSYTPTGYKVYEFTSGSGNIGF